MKLVFVLGSLSEKSFWQLLSLKADRIYYFSEENLAPLKFPVSSYYLPSPQMNPKIESELIDAVIERNIKDIASLGDDAAVIWRGLRLSELRIEAKCFLNAIDFIRENSLSIEGSGNTIVFISHYLLPQDVVPHTEFKFYWKQILNIRFIGFIPGLQHIINLLEFFDIKKRFSKKG